ncbi:MAG: hypothetical protein EOP06_12005 [Proteobacteria bacterium]|nr:MAG: hypothetical protein EOP06_12005 [Pseudomonadota bacterium]
MSFNFLKQYSVTGEQPNYALDFQIPDNCEFRAYPEDGINKIYIELKPGQSQPSERFVVHSKSYTTAAGLELLFVQNVDGKEVRKPKISISL